MIRNPVTEAIIITKRGKQRYVSEEARTRALLKYFSYTAVSSMSSLKVSQL